MKARKLKYIHLGSHSVTPNLSVVVSKDKSGKYYIGQLQTFHNADETRVNIFRRRATLCVTADDLRQLAKLFSDIADLHK